MAIETNNAGAPQNETQGRSEPKFDQGTSGPTFTSAPQTGAFDFLGLKSHLTINRIDATVEPYLNDVKKLVDNELPNSVELITLTKLNSAYAFVHKGNDGTMNIFGILFASASDPVTPEFFPASMKLQIMKAELEQRFINVRHRICDGRVILAGYEPDMARSAQMASTIVRTFKVCSETAVREANIDVLTTNEFVVDWRLSEGRAVERELSPHGVAPRMDIALTLKAKVRNDLGREFRGLGDEYVTLGVIGGYTDFREKEIVTMPNGVRALMYRPTFNITVCNAYIPLPGVAAVLLAAFAPTIYNTKHWARQFEVLGKDHPNPGMLEENPDDRGKPIILTDREELSAFIDAKIATPHIVFQFQDGRDTIPGMFRMASPNAEQRMHFLKSLADFFKDSDANFGNADMTRLIETKFNGAIGDAKGQLHDSRDVDYLYIAAHNGYGAIDHNMRRILLGGAENPTDRARIVQHATNSFIPLYYEQDAVVNPDFIKWVIDRTSSRGLQIVDPNSQMEARPLGSFLEGFGSTQGMGSIVHHGIAGRTYNFGSVWNN